MGGPTVSVDQLLAKIGQLTVENEWYKNQAANQAGAIAALEGEVTRLRVAAVEGVNGDGG